MIRFVSLAALLILPAAAATAAPLQRVPTMKVAYGDLDLSRPGDAAILLGRIQAAARSVCVIGDDDDRGPQTFFVARALIQHCVDASAKQAMAMVQRKMGGAAPAPTNLASGNP
jgi:UrcA family protein